MFSSPEPQLSLKLLVDKKRKKILFGEADKNFIDFLFTILALPIGTIINLVSKEAVIGPLGNLYRSVDNLNINYFLPKQNKDNLLKPKVPIAQSQFPAVLAIELLKMAKEIYICPKSFVSRKCTGYVSFKPTATCPECKGAMNHKTIYIHGPDETKVEEASSNEEMGYVKGMVTYLVMEDLTVKPMSAISTTLMLNHFKVEDVGLVEEIVVYFDFEEAVNLLKASLQSTTILSDVFLHQIDFENMTISRQVSENNISTRGCENFWNIWED